MSQSVLFNSGIALSGRIATLALGILATALITRILGAAQFGQYSFVATIATFLQLTADFGLYLTASRELGYGDGHDIQFGHILSLRGIFLLIIYSLGALVFFLLPTLHPLALLFVILAVGFAVQSMSQLFMSIFQAYGVVWRATISDITGRMVQVALLWAFYAHTMVVSQRILEVAAAFSGGLFIAWCIHIVLIPRKKLLVPAISFSIWRKIIKISMPIGALLVLNTIYFRIDTVMLALYRTPQEVGWYALAYRIIDNTLFFPAMLGGLVLPHISRALKNNNYVHSRRLIEEALSLSLSLAIPLVALLVLFATNIVVMISGNQFSISGPILAVLAWATGIMFVGNILGFSLIALQRQRDLLLLYVALVLVTIVMNLVYIPLFGALGAAWVTVVIEGIATTVASFLVYREIPWGISFMGLSKIMLATTIAVCVGLVLPSSLSFIIRISAICAVYAILGYTTGIWNQSTTSMLRSAKSI